MSGSTSILDLILTSQANKEAVANALFDAAYPAMMFGRRPSTSSGLTWGYFGGTLNVGGTRTLIANGTIALTPSATNYVEASGLGVVSVNTTGFSASKMKLYQVVCGASSVTSYEDYRASAMNRSSETDLIVTNAAVGAQLDIDCRTANFFDLTLTASSILHFINPPATGTPYSMTVIVRQDATGSRTYGLNTVSGTQVKWTGGTIPTVSSAANAIDIYTFFTIDGGVTWFGFQAGKGMA